MMRHSGTAARVYADKLPVFEGALELLRGGVTPGAVERNSEFAGEDLIAANGVAEEYKNLGFGSETSGGLLIAVPQQRYKTLVSELNSRGVLHSTVGEVIHARAGSVELAMSGHTGEKMQLKNETETSRREQGCCSEASGGNEARGTADASMKAFGELIGSVTASGKIDKRVKELIIFSLTVSQRCEPCVAMHYDKALAMGITPEELDEAAWCAVLIGGAPVKMFYGEYLKRRAAK
jgi:AhpD family alkylhydroperoxidase